MKKLGKYISARNTDHEVDARDPWSIPSQLFEDNGESSALSSFFFTILIALLADCLLCILIEWEKASAYGNSRLNLIVLMEKLYLKQI